MRPSPAVRTIHVGGFSIGRHGRFWSVFDNRMQLVCVAVYRKGALEVVRRLLPADLRHLVDECPRRPVRCREPTPGYHPHAT